MSPRSSLLRRAVVPLLAVAAAAALCASSRAATDSWATCQVVNPGTPYVGIAQRVDCHFTANARWQEADFHTKLLGTGDGYGLWLQDMNMGLYCGTGDYFDPQSGYYLCRPGGSGTYDCWCVCSGMEYDGQMPWNVSTGGTYYVTVP